MDWTLDQSGEIWQRMFSAAQAEYERAMMMNSPSMMLRPRLFVDGNQWCALYGENIEKGVCGFGDSPAEAYAAFDKAWYAKLPADATKGGG
jgi:hypothetical protein